MIPTYDEWKKGAQPGVCWNCSAEVPVRMVSPSQASSYPTLSWVCFLCSVTPSAIEVSNTRPLFAAMSIMLNAIKPMPKPRKPRQSKKITVEPMTPRRGR